VKFIERFVNTVTAVMERKFREHLNAVNHVTCRRRLFAFAADMVTQLHMTGDAIGMFVITEEGELKALFVVYVLVTKQIGHSLMR